MEGVAGEKSAYQKIMDAEGVFTEAAERLMEANCDLLLEQADKETSVRRAWKLRQKVNSLHGSFRLNVHDAKRIVGNPGFALRFLNKEALIGMVIGAVFFGPFVPLIRPLWRGFVDFVIGVF